MALGNKPLKQPQFHLCKKNDGKNSGVQEEERFVHDGL